MIAMRHGANRVWQELLGHVWPGDSQGEHKGASMIALESVVLGRALLRGCEWAATGKVTIESIGQALCMC